MVDIARERHDEFEVLVLSGRLDSSTAPDLEAILKESLNDGVDRLLVDFAAVTYISSAGLRAILMAAKAIKRVDGRFVLSSLSENVFQVFETAGFSKILSFARTRAEGVGLVADGTG